MGSLLSEMQCHKLENDIISYNSAISACEKGQQWMVALSLLFEIHTSNALQPDGLSYNSAILACAKSYQWMLAFSLLDIMSSSSILPDANCYSRMLFECEQRCLMNKEVELINQLCSALGDHCVTTAVHPLASKPFAE